MCVPPRHSVWPRHSRSAGSYALQFDLLRVFCPCSTQHAKIIILRCQGGVQANIQKEWRPGNLCHTSAVPTPKKRMNASLSHMPHHSHIQRAVRLQYIDADLVASLGARCMDGTPGGFYYAVGGSRANASRLIIHLEGGGECRTARACATWAFHSGSSTTWPALRLLPNALRSAWPGSPMDPSLDANPDFHDWAKLFVPYCSADMHSGTRTSRSQALGGWFFAGHNILHGAMTQLARLWPRLAPTDVLVTGSSAGGIAAILHADWFAARWPRARLKVSPEAGFFYPPVNALRDATVHHRTTPLSAMGMHPEWQPFLHAGCAAAVSGVGHVDTSSQSGSGGGGGSGLATEATAQCTNAHVLIRHIATPLFVRENLYDVAKLANCGVDLHDDLDATALAYLRDWGRHVRTALTPLRTRRTHGFYLPSCLAHASNLRFSTSPRVGGVRLIDAMHAWFFGDHGGGDGGGDGRGLLQYAIDDCGELPCTNDSHATTDQCPLLQGIRKCRGLCRLHKQRRRIRLGLNPRVPGHNVCAIEDDESTGTGTVTGTGPAAVMERSQAPAAMLQAQMALAQAQPTAGLQMQTTGQGDSALVSNSHGVAMAAQPGRLQAHIGDGGSRSDRLRNHGRGGGGGDQPVDRGRARARRRHQQRQRLRVRGRGARGAKRGARRGARGAKRGVRGAQHGRRRVRVAGRRWNSREE